MSYYPPQQKSTTTTTIITLLIVLIILLGLSLAWMYFSNLSATQTNDQQEGLWEPLPVEELPGSGAIDGENPLAEAAGLAPDGTDLIQIFQSVGQANNYWSGYRPTYPLGFITTGGGEAVSMGSSFNEINFNFFGSPKTLDNTRYEIGATVHGGILVGITRQAIVDSIDQVIPQEDGTLQYTANLPPECVLLLAIPVSANSPENNGSILSGDQESPFQTNIDLDRIIIPNSWLSFGFNLDQRYNPAELAQNAINQGTYQVFVTLNKEDLVHQSHVLSVESPTPTNAGTNTLAGQHAYSIINAIIKEAICWKISQNGFKCDSNLITGTINAAPAPNRLRRCGTGQIIIDEPYAIIHRTLPNN